jgi:hypothetical protein
MKKALLTETKRKADRKRVEAVARQLCKQAGHDPDDVILWKGEYGYQDYPIPVWHRLTSQAKKLIAAGTPSASLRSHRRPEEV